MWRILVFLSVFASAQAADWTPLAPFATEHQSDLRLTARSVPHIPWTVAGERGAVLGRQDGVFEAWQWPVKLISHFRISAQIQDYPVPIDVNALSSVISVTPAETVITYSHSAFTIRQHAFAARGGDHPQAGAALFFEVYSVRPITITFSFTPEMLRMWPAPNFGRPDGEWVKNGASGFYVLHTDNPKLLGVVGMPDTQPGILVPYQEHPQTYPLQFKLAFDPRRDSGKIFPLIMATSDGSAPKDQILAIHDSIASLYQKTHAYYAAFDGAHTHTETPDPKLDQAVRWAEVAIDQMQVDYHGETGMVAGYYESADSARPGYAWFFGRDTLWTTYAINSYGDFPLTRRALDFLIKRQRSDGKIMHEFSQSADAIDWSQTPYFYASADAAPLLVMAVWDYVRASGDVAYLRQNWGAVQKAYAFERSHDSDGDGIYENTEGTGWVESWPPGMPHQEAYLAALDQQSADAMAHLADLMQQPEISQAARTTASKIGQTIASEYFDSGDRFYAFSRNADGSLDKTPSIYPAVAWWQGNYTLSNAANMLSRWAAPEFSTDWGTRDITSQSPYFDPISYHQGTVWPLFTGWVSLAEYRAGRPLSAYAHLKQNVDLTWLQDLGSATELLSGEFYQPLGRSSSHQMWSSAMILAPLFRGLFGLQPDAVHHTLAVDPHLPAEWDHARIQNVRVGESSVDLEFARNGANLNIRATTKGGIGVCLVHGDTEPKNCAARPEGPQTLTIPLPAVELSIGEQALEQGDRTHALKVLNEELGARDATFTVSAPAGTAHRLYVRANNSQAVAPGFTIHNHAMEVHFPEGTGYQTIVIKFHW